MPCTWGTNRDDMWSFRVWNEKTKSYVVHCKPWVISKDDKENVISMVKLQEDKYTFERCVGVRDTKFNRVFENDLVLFCRNMDDPESTVTDLCVVKYDIKSGGRYILMDARSSIFEDGRYAQPISYSLKGEITVVGNIHQNKDLINTYKKG